MPSYTATSWYVRIWCRVCFVCLQKLVPVHIWWNGFLRFWSRLLCLFEKVCTGYQYIYDGLFYDILVLFRAGLYWYNILDAIAFNFLILGTVGTLFFNLHSNKLVGMYMMKLFFDILVAFIVFVYCVCSVCLKKLVPVHIWWNGFLRFWLCLLCLFVVFVPFVWKSSYGTGTYVWWNGFLIFW